jgi:hypothetical protein
MIAVAWGSPEPFDSGGREDVLRGAEALNDSEPSDGLGEDLSSELPALVGDEVLGRTEGPGGHPEETGHGRGSRLVLVSGYRQRSSGESVEDGGQVELATQEGLDDGHVHHPDVVRETGDHGMTRPLTSWRGGGRLRSLLTSDAPDRSG